MTAELAMVGSQCRGERHDQVIARQRDALVELRAKIRVLETGNNPRMITLIALQILSVLLLLAFGNIYDLLFCFNLWTFCFDNLSKFLVKCLCEIRPVSRQISRRPKKIRLSRRFSRQLSRGRMMYRSWLYSTFCRKKQLELHDVMICRSALLPCVY